MFWCNSSLDCLSLAPFLRFGLSNRTWNERVPVWEQETLSTVLDVLIRAKRSKSSQELTHEWRQFRTLKLTVTPCVHFLMGSFSRGWDVAVYVWHNPTELAHSFLFCSCVCFCLYGSFTCDSFLKFSRQLSVFSLCSSGLISALLVLSAIHISLYESLLQPCHIP